MATRTEWHRGDPVEFQIDDIFYRGVFLEAKNNARDAEVQVDEMDGKKLYNLSMLVNTSSLQRMAR